MDQRYSNESLKMLKTEEGQLNAVYACFGSAVQHAQLFEQALTRFLTIYNRIAADSVSFDDIGRKWTLGQLLRKVRQHVRFDDESVDHSFEVALKNRNFLIHHFFLDRSSALSTTEGRLALLNELIGIESDLERCRVTVNAMRIAMCETIGIRDDWVSDYS